MSTGDHPDFAAFYRREFPRLARSLRPFVGDAAEDIAQEAMLVASDRWDDVATLDSPYAWVRKVAGRIGGRRNQRDRRRSELELSLGDVGVEPAPPDLDVVAQLLELPSRHAAAVWLHHAADRSMKELAAELGCSEGAAKVLALRGRRLLAERSMGLRGRWVTERRFTTDQIVAIMTERGWRQHVDPVLADLEGSDGRWEFSVDDGRYELHRRDGLRLDVGTCWLTDGVIHLSPTYAAGEFRLTPRIDGDRAGFRFRSSSLPPTAGVPDAVWAQVWYEAASFAYVGPPVSAV